MQEQSQFDIDNMQEQSQFDIDNMSQVEATLSQDRDAPQLQSFDSAGFKRQLKAYRAQMKREALLPGIRAVRKVKNKLAKKARRAQKSGK